METLTLVDIPDRGALHTYRADEALVVLLTRCPTCGGSAKVVPTAEMLAADGEAAEGGTTEESRSRKRGSRSRPIDSADAAVDVPELVDCPDCAGSVIPGHRSHQMTVHRLFEAMVTGVSLR